MQMIAQKAKYYGGKHQFMHMGPGSGPPWKFTDGFRVTSPNYVSGVMKDSQRAT